MLQIAQRRKAMGMTQRQLADLLKVSVMAVSAWERGEKNPAAGRLPALASVLRCTIDELYGEKGEF